MPRVKIKAIPKELAQKGGITVNNKNDPRYKAYQDSMSAYKFSQNQLRDLNVVPGTWDVNTDKVKIKNVTGPLNSFTNKKIATEEDYTYKKWPTDTWAGRESTVYDPNTGKFTPSVRDALLPLYPKPKEKVSFTPPSVDKISSMGVGTNNTNINMRPLVWNNVTKSGVFPMYGKDNRLIGTWDQKDEETFFYPSMNSKPYTEEEIKDLPKNTKISKGREIVNLRRAQTGMLINPDLHSSMLPNMISFLGEGMLEANRPRDYENNPWALPAAGLNLGMSALKGVSNTILDYQKQKESQRVAAQNLNNNYSNNAYNNFYSRGNTYFQDGGITELTVLDNQGNAVRFDPFKYSTIEEAQDAYALQQQEADLNQESLEEKTEDNTNQDQQELEYNQEDQQFFNSLNEEGSYEDTGYSIDIPQITNMSSDAKIRAFAKIENSGKEIGDHGNGAIDAFGYRKTGHLSEAWKTPAYQPIRERFGSYAAFYEVLRSGRNPEINNLNNQLYSNWLESKYPGDIAAQAKFNLTGNANSPDNTVIGKNLSAGSYTQKIVKALYDNTIAKKQNGGLVMNKFQKGGLTPSEGKISSIYTKTDTPNIEWERGEHILLPNGVSFHQDTGNKHTSNPETSGVKAEAPDNTFIFSDFIKAPKNIIKGFLGKKEDEELTKSEKKFSFADLAKKFETSKDIENQASEDKYKANSAKLNLINKQPKLENLKFAQEIYKYGKGMDNDLEKLVELQAQPKPQFGSLVSDELPIAQSGGLNTFSPQQVNTFKKRNAWGNAQYWNRGRQNAATNLGYTGDNSANQMQNFFIEQYPELVNYAFDQGYWPNTNKGVQQFGNVPATSLTPQQQLQAFGDQKQGVRFPMVENKVFNTQEELDQWAGGRNQIQSNGSTFYDTRQGDLVNYTQAFVRPQDQVDPIPTPDFNMSQQPVNPNITANPLNRLPSDTINNSRTEQVNPDTGMPYNMIDLSQVRMAEGLSLLGALRPSKVNYPSLRELPTLEQPVLLDQVPIANSAYNRAIGNTLSQLRNSGLSPQEKMVASGNVIAKSLDQQPNSELYVAQQNLINNNINRTNQFNINTLNTKNQMLDKYQAQVNSVYAGKEKDANNRMSAISKYIGNDAKRNLEVQQWMSQTGSDYHIGQDGNVYFRPDPMNSFLQEAMINLQAMQNNQLTQTQQQRQKK